MVCRVEVTGGPVAVKNAKSILSVFQWKDDGEMICEDFVPKLLQALGYTVVEQRWNQHVFGATPYVELHGEYLPPLQDQICLTVMWVVARFGSHRSYLREKLDRLNSLL